MRKLFVFALVVALFPFAVGCRIDGLWGSDDDYGTATTTTATANNVVLASNLTLPAAGTDLTGVPQAALAAKSYQITIDGQVLDLVSYTTSGTNVVLSFSKTVTAASLGLSSTTTSKTATVTISYGGVTLYTATVTISCAVSSTAVTSATNTLTIIITTNPDLNGDGILDNPTGFAVTITMTSPTGTVINVTPTTTGTTTGKFFIGKQEFSTDNGATYQTLSGSQGSPSGLGVTSFDGGKIKVTFSEAPANLSTAIWTVKIDNKNTTTPTGTQLSSTENKVTVVADGATGAIITINAGSGVTLSSTGLYEISVVSTDLKNATNVALDTSAKAYVVVGTKLSGITNSAGTTLVGGSYTVGSTLTTTFKLVFDAALKASTTFVGTVEVKRYASNGGALETTFNVTNSDATQALSTDGKTLTLTFNQALVAGKYYTVTYKSGALTDTNGYVVNLTGTTFSFTTN